MNIERVTKEDHRVVKNGVKIVVQRRQHIVPFRNFNRIGSAPPETLPNFNYDTPEEVCGSRKLFDSAFKKRPKTNL